MPLFHFTIKYGFVLFLLLLFCQNPVQATDDEFQQWSTISLLHKINDQYFINLLGQGRFAISDDRPNTYVMRPSIHYNFTGSITGGLGYDYLLNDPGNNEQRLWQEVMFKNLLGKSTLSHRFRLEERFIEEIPVIYRTRYNLKANYPLSGGKWALVGSNEIFFNLNSRGTGPAPGLDQNRLFAGLGYRTGANSKVEFGYLWRYLNRRDTESINDHIIVFNLYIEH